jgi:hypothetical protein
MTGILADAVQRLKLQPGQTVREPVNGHTAELRLLEDDWPTPELAEQVMLLPWWEPPFDAVAAVVATPGSVSLPDPPLIPPDDDEP